MSLNTRRALTNGYDTLTSKDGVNVVSVLLVFNIAYGAVSQSFRQQVLETVRDRQSGARFPPPFDIELFAFELPLSLLAVLTVGAIIANEGVRVWAIQLFADRPTPTVDSRLTVLVPIGGGFAVVLYGLRQLLPIVLNGLVPGPMLQLTYITSIVVAPLLFFTVYLRQEIALTDSSIRTTIHNSVARVRDDPVPIFGLLLVVALLGQLAILPAAVLSRVITLRAGTEPAILVNLCNRILAAVLSTFSIAAVTDAYLQVRDTEAEASGG